MVSLPRNSLGEARLIGSVPALYERLMGMGNLRLIEPRSKLQGMDLR